MVQTINNDNGKQEVPDLNGEHDADDGEDEGRPAATAEQSKEGKAEVVLGSNVALSYMAREYSRFLQLWDCTMTCNTSVCSDVLYIP